MLGIRFKALDLQVARHEMPTEWVENRSEFESINKFNLDKQTILVGVNLS